MESSTPGFIAQLKGKPTKHRYRDAKIFLYHHSDLNYVHLQRGLSSEEKVQAKKIITQTMVDFQTTPSYRKVWKKPKQPAIAEWILTLKMARQKNASEISKSTQENSFITPKQGGRAPYNWCYGRTLYEKIVTFAIAYPTRKEPPHH